MKKKIIQMLFKGLKPEEQKAMKNIFATEDDLADVEAAEATTAEGATIRYEGETPEVGMEIFIVGEDGTEAPAPDGEHTLEDGTVIVAEGGKIAEVKAAEPAEQEMSEDLAKRIKDLEDAIASNDKVEELEAKLAERESEIKVLAAMFEKFMEMPQDDEPAPSDVQGEGYTIQELRASFRKDLKDLNRGKSEEANAAAPTTTPNKGMSAKKIADLEEKFKQVNNN